MKQRRYLVCAAALLLMLLWIPRCIFAKDNQEIEKEKVGEEKMEEEKINTAVQMILEQLEFTEIEGMLREIFPEGRVSFQKVLGELLHGNIKKMVGMLGKMFRDRLFYEIRVNRKNMIRLLLLAVTAAILTNFSGLMKNRQISVISFYLLYLLLLTIGVGSFETIMDAAEENLGMLTGFIRVLAPVYLLAVAFAAGFSTSAMFYHLMLVLIYIVELIVIRFLLPAVHVYVMVKVLDYLNEEEYLSKFAELLETVIQWTLKILLTGVIGMNVVQGLLGPAMDSLSRNAVLNGAEMIPGIGDVIGGVGQTVIGTAVLIKNGIGVGALMICVMICLIPVVQMGVLVLMYKVTAAVIQPISDKRIVECIGGIGDGCRILLQILLTSGILFLITIAIVAATAG